MQLVGKDAFFCSVMEELEKFGYQILFKWWGQAGSYHPYGISVASEVDTGSKAFQESFLRQVEHGDLLAEFKFSNRFGLAIISHTWLHELMHFYQDLHGLFLMPVQKKGQIPVMLDAQGEVTLMLFLEALAATEAIRASWRLQKHGDVMAWKGAMLSPDWRWLAKAYQRDVEAGTKEITAAQNLFKNWYQSALRKYYEKRTLKAIEKTFSRFSKSGNIQPNLRALFLPDLKKTFPILKQHDFLDWKALADPFFHGAVTRSVQKSLARLEDRIGKADNMHISDIAIGAPPYLWKSLSITS